MGRIISTLGMNDYKIVVRKNADKVEGRPITTPLIRGSREGGGRTHTLIRAHDPKSCLSANSSTSPGRQNYTPALAERQ